MCAVGDDYTHHLLSDFQSCDYKCTCTHILNTTETTVPAFQVPQPLDTLIFQNTSEAMLEDSTSYEASLDTLGLQYCLHENLRNRRACVPMCAEPMMVSEMDCLARSSAEIDS